MSDKESIGGLIDIDRRQGPRVYSSVRVAFPYVGKLVEARALDLSETGMKLWSPSGIPKGTRLFLHVFSPDKTVTYRITSHVTWVANGADGFSIGLRFQQMSDPARHMITSMVKQGLDNGSALPPLLETPAPTTLDTDDTPVTPPPTQLPNAPPFIERPGDAPPSFSTQPTVETSAPPGALDDDDGIPELDISELGSLDDDLEPEFTPPSTPLPQPAPLRSTPATPTAPEDRPASSVSPSADDSEALAGQMPSFGGNAESGDGVPPWAAELQEAIAADHAQRKASAEEANALVLQAHHLRDGGQLKEATVKLRQALKLTPDRRDLLEELARLLYAQSDIAGAAELFDRALTLAQESD